MKGIFAAIVLALAACAALADDGTSSADIKIYRVLTDIGGPKQVPGAASGAEKEEAAILTLSFIMGSPATLTAGGMELNVQNPEVRWGNSPEPNRPDILLLADMTGIEFKEEATVTLSEPPDTEDAKNAIRAMGAEGFRLYCSHGQGRDIGVLASLERPHKTEQPGREPAPFPAPEDLWQKVTISPEPESWTALIFSVSTLTGKPAGSFLVLLKTHGRDFVAEAPQNRAAEYVVEMKFIKMPAITADTFRGKYEKLKKVNVTPESAEIFRIGLEEPRKWGGAKEDRPTLLNWLNDQDSTELLSAPRITLAPRTDSEPPRPKEDWLKVVLRAHPATPEEPLKENNCDSLTTMVSEFAPRLASFLEEHQKEKPGIIADMTTEYDHNKERDRIVRDVYGVAAGVALKPISGEDAVQTSTYLNVKNKHESKRGLKFWKKPAPPTFVEFPSEATLTVRDRECIGLLRPYEPAGMWLLCTVCVTRVHAAGAPVSGR